jgi:hypothetical protein
MKKQLTAIVFCAAAVLVVGSYAASIVLAQAQCRVPSIHSKLCDDLESIASCEAQNAGNCVGSAIYVVNPVPDGTDPAANGVTKEVQAECYTKTPCRQKAQSPQQCEAAPTEQPVSKKKTVDDPDVTCPNS